MYSYSIEKAKKIILKLYIIIGKSIMKGRFINMKLYTINELETVLHRKAKTIKDYIIFGGLEASNINGRYLVSEEDLKKFLENYKISN